MEAGAKQRVAIGSDIVLDFTGLFGADTAEKQPSKTPSEPLLEAGEYKTITEAKKPAERLTDGLEREQAKTLIIDHRRAEEDHRRSLEVYRTYQANIKASSQLQTDILKGVKAGESIYSLFLKAAKAISLMTSNSVFYSQIEADTRAIYGEGLQEQAPLENELAEVQQRLTKLNAAQSREIEPGSRERIGKAIKAHEEKIARLTDQIERANRTI